MLFLTGFSLYVLSPPVAKLAATEFRALRMIAPIGRTIYQPIDLCASHSPALRAFYAWEGNRLSQLLHGRPSEMNSSETKNLPDEI